MRTRANEVRVRHGKGTTRVRALVPKINGLTIVKYGEWGAYVDGNYVTQPKYGLTHIRSGMAVAHFKTFEAAKRAYDSALCSGLDWTLPCRIIVKQSQQHKAFVKNVLFQFDEYLSALDG